LTSVVLRRFFPLFLRILPPPRSTLFPYTTLFRSGPVSYSAAVERAAPAVVNIYSSRVVAREQHPLMSDPFFRQFFGDELPQHQRSEEHTSELQSRFDLVCRLLLEKKKKHTLKLYH